MKIIGVIIFIILINARYMVIGEYDWKVALSISVIGGIAMFFVAVLLDKLGHKISLKIRDKLS